MTADTRADARDTRADTRADTRDTASLTNSYPAYWRTAQLGDVADHAALPTCAPEESGEK